MEEENKVDEENNVSEIKSVSVAKETHSHQEGKLTKKMRENPWILSTFVLGVLTLILLIGNFGGVTGGVVSGDDAGEAVINFVKSQGADVELLSVNEDGNFYEAIISFQGQEIPLYVTKDGEFLVQGLTPLNVVQQTATPQQQQPTEIPKSDKPMVEVFVMSFCPYGMEAQKIFSPVADLLGDVADFRVRFVYYAMHDKKEIDENFVQYCIQEEEPNKYTNYLNCFLESGDTNGCLNSAGISKSKIDSCISKKDKEFKITEKYNDKSTWFNGRYPLFDIEKEIGDSYGVQGSEAIVINGITLPMSSYRWSSENLKIAVCDAFNDAPEECSKILEEGVVGSVQGSC